MSDKTKFELPSNMYVRVQKDEYSLVEICLYERRWYGIGVKLWSENLSKFEGGTVRHAAEYMYKREMQWRDDREYSRSVKSARKAAYEKIKGRYPPKDLDTIISGG